MNKDLNLKKAYIDFFKSKGHDEVASASLVPNDETLLFNNAGMVAFKSIFTGETLPPANAKLISCQACIRAGGKHNDLENVGFTARHHTFFEMLGNFSFGDYFKKEAISYAWEFLTQIVKLPINKLWVTVHKSDDEAFKLWEKHINRDRIVRLGDADNFWQMGDTGPCGPSSEIFFDQGAEHFSTKQDYLGGDGDRFLEIWNLVFMQYERDKQGKLNLLPKPSIDTGMGVERLIAVSQGYLSNYDTYLFMPIINAVAKMTNTTYIYKTGARYRIIADHIRAVTFLLAQDVTFHKEGRGYVLRRILRRAVRHGYLLGLKEPFMYKLATIVISMMREQYLYLEEKKDLIKTQIKFEEERFYKTISSGITLFNDELKNSKKSFSSEAAFKLYDTFGFPLDLTQEMLKEKNITLETKEFDALMLEQKNRAKASWKGSGDNLINGDFKILLQKYGKNRFIGYETLKSKCKIVALLDENFKIIHELNQESKGWVFLDKTPFYAQSGGQVGDSGMLNGIADVLDTQKFFDLNISQIEIINSVKVNTIVVATVSNKRTEIEKHHSATHLLHASLFQELGTHISQAGSFNNDKRLRFDFSHTKALTSTQIQNIEKRINLYIQEEILAKTEIMSIKEAKNSGAKAQFEQKYDENVRVVSFGNASRELCGGTHVKNSANIGMFIITKEIGISAGVRRIEAVVGKQAYYYFKQQQETLNEIIKEVKSIEPITAIKKLQEQIKLLKSKSKQNSSLNREKFKPILINGVTIIIEEISDGDIKENIDVIKNEYSTVATMLFQIKDDKVIIAAGVKGSYIKAGDWVKKIAPIINGGGGGRADFAQAGGKDSSKLPFAKEEALKYIQKNLK